MKVFDIKVIKNENKTYLIIENINKNIDRRRSYNIQINNASITLGNFNKVRTDLVKGEIDIPLKEGMFVIYKDYWYDFNKLNFIRINEDKLYLDDYIILKERIYIKRENNFVFFNIYNLLGENLYIKRMFSPTERDVMFKNNEYEFDFDLVFNYKNINDYNDVDYINFRIEEIEDNYFRIKLPMRNMDRIIEFYNEEKAKSFIEVMLELVRQLKGEQTIKINNKTQKMLEVEKEFGRTIEDLLIEKYIIKTYDRHTIAYQLGISESTLDSWMSEADIKTRRLFTLRELNERYDEYFKKVN